MDFYTQFANMYYGLEDIDVVESDNRELENYRRQALEEYEQDLKEWLNIF